MSICNPLIIFGWPRIRNYYSWTGNKTLTFWYYGEDSFLMIVCEHEGNHSPASFRPFHNLSSIAGDYQSFQMTMNNSNVCSSKLVSFLFYYLLTISIQITKKKFIQIIICIFLGSFSIIGKFSLTIRLFSH
jgi:hypothetical protein